MLIISRIYSVYTLPIDVWTTVVFWRCTEKFCFKEYVCARAYLVPDNRSEKQWGPVYFVKELHFFCSLELNHDNPAHTHVRGAVPSPSHQPDQPPQCCLGDWVGISHSLVVVLPDGVCWWLGLCPTHKCVCCFFSFFFLHFKWVPLKYKISFFDPGETI